MKRLHETSTPLGALLVLGLIVAPGMRAQTPELASVVAADNYVEQIAEARRLAFEMMEESATPGVSIAVAINGQVLWSEGFGWADVELRVPVDVLTKFRVGSVSKSLSAAAMGILMDEGKLDFDAPVQAYVPEFPKKRWPITSRQVAGHVAGVRHYRGTENFSTDRYPDVTSGLAIFAEDSLLFEPSTDWSYSSYGWNLLSVVVERAAGVDFLPYVRDRVFEPLGMLHTVADHTDSIVANRTRFYVRNRADGRVRNAPYVDNSYKWAGGGFLSTPEDLIRFGSAHLEAGFLSSVTLEDLFTRQVLSNGETTTYGVGWFVRPRGPGGRVVYHTGGSVGGTTILLINRDSGLVVAAVGNMSNVPIPALGRAIMSVFSKE